MILPEEDSISYLPFFGIEPPPAIMGDAIYRQPDDSRERAYQDEMRRG